MAQDDTLEQLIETTLYTAGVHESGHIASAIVEQITDDIRDDPEKWLINVNKLLQGHEVTL